MRLRSTIVVAISLAVLAGAAEHHRHIRSRTGSRPGDFDYYVLALSWSPEFCYSHADKPECRGHYGFIVHGLWPQFADGYPENCSTQNRNLRLADMSDLMPDPELVRHEWKTHGTCSGLDPAGYFALIKRAYSLIKVPSRFNHPTRGFSIVPADLKQEFLVSNSHLKNGELVVSCGNNYLTGVSICFTKNLEPTACQSLNDCRANTIRVPPVH
jgi:ribonuclease T2